MSSGLDAYAVVTAQPPEPPAEPDHRAEAQALREDMFAQERDAGAWTAPLSPARPGRQRHPATPEASGAPGDTAAAEPPAMCILDSNGTHAARGRHCPHGLRAPGDTDEIIPVSFWP